MTDYELGTVAVATVRGVPNVRVFRIRSGWVLATLTEGWFLHPGDGHVTDVRPLAVVDPEDNPAEIANRLSEASGRQLVVLDLSDEELSFVRWQSRAIAGSKGTRDVWDKLADQIEQQTRPPKPPEPTGLGAVVEDADGAQWVLVPDESHPWVKAHRDPAAYTLRSAYGAIDAVKVLSDGVQP